MYPINELLCILDVVFNSKIHSRGHDCLFIFFFPVFLFSCLFSILLLFVFTPCLSRLKRSREREREREREKWIRNGSKPIRRRRRRTRVRGSAGVNRGLSARRTHITLFRAFEKWAEEREKSCCRMWLTHGKSRHFPPWIPPTIVWIYCWQLLKPPSRLRAAATAAPAAIVAAATSSSLTFPSFPSSPSSSPYIESSQSKSTAATKLNVSRYIYSTFYIQRETAPKLESFKQNYNEPARINRRLRWNIPNHSNG